MPSESPLDYGAIAVATMTDGLVVELASGEIAYSNPAAERILGLSRERIASGNVRSPRWQTVREDGSPLPEDERPGAVALRTGAAVRDFLLGVRRPDDLLLWLSVTSVPLDGGEGRAAAVVNTFADVTARRTAEEDLRQSEERYRFLTENAVDVIWTLDPATGRFTYVSPSVERLRGFTAEEVMAQSMAESLTPESLETVLRGFSSVAESVAESAGPSPIRVTRVDQPRRDGSIVATEVVTRTVRDASGNVVEVLGVTRDITARLAAEDAIRSLAADLERRVHERTAQLEEASRELEAVSYSVAHELRTPLRAIDARAALVAEGLEPRLDDEGRRHLADLRWNAQRMGRLIDDLLAFSRAGRTDLHVGRVDMAAAAREAFARVAPGPGPRAAFSVGDLPAVRGDGRLLQLVWENLLSNAVKFSSARERPEVRVGGSLEGGEAVFAVSDNGVGFDMVHAGKLFQVFQRLHGVLEFEGTGVGLALVRRIVLRHGGRVRAEGRPGLGATFSFALPVTQA